MGEPKIPANEDSARPPRGEEAIVVSPPAPHAWSPGALAVAREAVAVVLRGVGQVMFQESALSGALFLAGIFWSSARFGVAALVGTIASTVAARLLGADRPLIRAGLFGFNGTLVGIGLAVFLEPGAASWTYLLFAAAISSVAMAALASVWKRWDGAALTAPFVLTTWCFLLAAPRFGALATTGLPTAALPGAAIAGGALDAAAIFEGVLKGVAQVFFQGDVVTGVLFVAGLVVSSRLAAAAALLGSLVGLLVGVALGAAAPELRAGLLGFNPCLTAIALGATSVAVDRRSLAVVLLGAVVTTVVAATLTDALRPLGMVALTAPFVIVVWAFTLAKPHLSALRAPR